jgi:3-(3-hydroxy-phenyl)propionate hydroxylase
LNLHPIALDVLTVGEAHANIFDKHGLLKKHYDAEPGTFYLIRPDQHIAARWRKFEPNKIQLAMLKASGN